MTKTCLRMLFAFLSVFIFAACSNDDDGDIKMKTPTQQTVYADQTTVTDAIKFVASNSWKATVTPVTRASEVEWLTLSAYSGGIGENSITITLTENNTGEDRKAQITIDTGETTIIITVEQKATKKDGTEPENGPSQNYADGDLITKIVQHDYYKHGSTREDDGEETYEFFYDKNRRLVKIVRTVVNELDYESSYQGEKKDTETEVETINITYGTGTVTYEITTTIDGVEQKEKTSGSIVLENGRAVSGKQIETDNYGEYVSTYTLSYDNAGYLVKSTRKENGEDCDDEVITWVNGNPEQVLWGYSGSKQIIDKATYGNVLNKTNIDLNWFLLDSEGWDFAAGDPWKVFAKMGYVGKRSANLANSMTNGAEYGYSDYRMYTYTYELREQGNMPIKVIKKNSADYGEECEYTIVYGN